MHRVDKATGFFAGEWYTAASERSDGVRIYADVVMGLNFLVDFLLLLGADRLCGFPTALKRCGAAAGLGALYSGGCFLPGWGFLGNTLWRTVFLCLMAVLAFGCDRSTLRRGGVFVMLSMNVIII